MQLSSRGQTDTSSILPNTQQTHLHSTSVFTLHPKSLTAPKTLHSTWNPTQTMFNIQDPTQCPRPALYPGPGKRSPQNDVVLLSRLWACGWPGSGPQQTLASQRVLRNPGERQWAGTGTDASSTSIQVLCKDSALDFKKLSWLQTLVPLQTLGNGTASAQGYPVTSSHTVS